MPVTGKRATGKVLELLAAPAGLNAQLAELAGSEAEAPARIEAAQMTPQNVAMELAERSRQVRYPAVHIYCEKLVNNLREKFRTFCGHGGDVGGGAGFAGPAGGARGWAGHAGGGGDAGAGPEPRRLGRGDVFRRAGTRRVSGR